MARPRDSALADVYGPGPEPAARPTPDIIDPFAGARRGGAPASPTFGADLRAEQERRLAETDQMRADAMRAAAEESVRRRTAAAKARMSDPSAIAADAAGQGREDFGAAMRMLGDRRTVTAPRPGYAATKGFTDTMLGTPERVGLVEQQAPLQYNADVTTLAREQVAAEVMAQTAEKQRIAMGQLRENQIDQTRREREQIDRIKAANIRAADATDAFAKTADVDPSRYWASAPAWQKFTAAIAAGLLGWAGRTDPTAHITGAIATDIDAQKARINRLQARAGEARQQADIENNLYGKILAQTGSEQEADLTYTRAMLEHAQSDMQAKLQRAGVHVLNAQQQQAMNSLQQAIASTNMQLERVAAANTPLVSRSVSPYTSEQRGLVRELGKQALKDRSAAMAAGVDVAQKREDTRAKLEQSAIEHGPGSLEERKFQKDMRKDMAGGEKGAAVETALGLVNDYLADYGEDIPGRTEGGVGGRAWFNEPDFWRSDEGLREIKRRDQISQWAASALTGANVSERQEEFLDRLARGENMSGDEIRAGINDLKRALELHQSTYQRIAEPSAEASYRGVDEGQLGSREQKVGGRRRADTSPDDQAAALGGRLR